MCNKIQYLINIFHNRPVNLYLCDYTFSPRFIKLHKKLKWDVT